MAENFDRLRLWRHLRSRIRQHGRGWRHTRLSTLDHDRVIGHRTNTDQSPADRPIPWRRDRACQRPV